MADLENAQQTEIAPLVGQDGVTPGLGGSAVAPRTKQALNDAGGTAISRIAGGGNDDPDAGATLEAKLLGKVTNQRLPPAERKAALRLVLCARRGIVYEKLAPADPQRAAIDAEVEAQLAELLAEEARDKDRARLDKVIDNAALSRQKRMDAFFAEYLLAAHIDLSTKTPEQRARLRADFDAREQATFDLRDAVMRERAKNTATMNNKKLPEPVRLEAYRAVFRGTYELSTQRRFADLTPDQQKVIDQRFATEFEPLFHKQVEGERRRAKDLAEAERLEAQLRARRVTKRFAWGSITTYDVPERPDLFRRAVALRTGAAPDSAAVNAAVATYRKKVEAQNGASQRKRSAAEYYNQGVVNAPKVTRADVEHVYPNVIFKDGISLAEAMFPESGMPLIAGSQRTPILIRVGALTHGEKKEVLEGLISSGRVLYKDLTRSIVLLTDDVMNTYLDKAIIQEKREQLPADQQAALQEWVLHAYKDDQRLAPGQESLYQLKDVEVAGVEGITGGVRSKDGADITGNLDAQTSDSLRRAAGDPFMDLLTGRGAQRDVDQILLGTGRGGNVLARLESERKQRSNELQLAQLIDVGVYHRVGGKLVFDQQRAKELQDAQQREAVTSAETERKRKLYHPGLADAPILGDIIGLIHDPSWFKALYTVAKFTCPVLMAVEQLQQSVERIEDLVRDGWKFDQVTEADIQAAIAQQNAVALSPAEIEQIKKDAADRDANLGKGFGSFTVGGIAEGFAGLERNFAGILRLTELVTGLKTGWEGYTHDAAKVDLLASRVGGGDEQAFYAAPLKMAGQTLVEAPKMMVLSLLPGGMVTACALDAGTQALGSGQRPSTVINAAITGAALGAVFEGASHLAQIVEKGALSQIMSKAPELKAGEVSGNGALLAKVLGEGTKLGTIAAGTVLVEAAAGKDGDEALRAALCNVLLDVAMRSGGALKISGRLFRVFAKGEEIDVSVDETGAVKRYARVPDQLVDAELLVEDRRGGGGDVSAKAERDQALAQYYRAEEALGDGGKLRPEQRAQLEKQRDDAAARLSNEAKPVGVEIAEELVAKDPAKAADYEQRVAILETLSPAEAARLREALRNAKAWRQVDEEAWRAVPKALRGEVLSALEDREPIVPTNSKPIVDPSGPSVLDAQPDAVRLDGAELDGLQYIKQKGGADATDGIILRDPRTGKEYFFKPDDVSLDATFEQETGQKMGMRERRAAASQVLFAAAGVDTPKVRLVEIKLGADGKPSPTGKPRRGTLQDWRTGTVDLKNFQGGPEAEAALMGTDAKCDIDALDYVVQHTDRVNNQANYLVSLDGKTITPVDNDMTFGLKTSAGVESPLPREITARMKAQIDRILGDRVTLAKRLGEYLTVGEVARTFERLEEVGRLPVRGGADLTRSGAANPRVTLPPPPAPVTDGIARLGEAWGNNINEGSCAHVAMRNGISARLAGLPTYVVTFDGLTGLGQTLKRFGIDPNGRIGQFLENRGWALRGGHAVAAVYENGAWRYISWGTVELDWRVFSRAVFGDSGQLRWDPLTPDEYVRWMVQNPHAHSEPQGTSPLLDGALREQADQAGKLEVDWVAPP